MISSPCKDCQKKNLPKDECLKDCLLIQGIQGMQLARKESNVYTAVDLLSLCQRFECLLMRKVKYTL